MAFHDAYEHPGKKAIHEKLIQSDTVQNTFADNSLKDEEAGSGSAADRIIDKRGRSTIEPDPFAPSSEEPTSLPLALGRIHKRLSNPEELKKLHLQHHHMTTDQF